MCANCQELSIHLALLLWAWAAVSLSHALLLRAGLALLHFPARALLLDKAPSLSACALLRNRKFNSGCFTHKKEIENMR